MNRLEEVRPAAHAPRPPLHHRAKARARRAAMFPKLGPGLITGAADDDPSGVASYSQAGAQFGFDMLWTLPFLFPLTSGIQMVSARIGRVTGHGLAANLRTTFPDWLVTLLVGLLFVANTINIGADLAAMGAAGKLVTGWNAHVLTIGFALASITLQILIPYHRYARFLRWLTLVLFAYFGVALTVQIDWAEVAARTFVPHLALTGATAITVVAVFGTTISPYLLFWQASEEVEEEEAEEGSGPLLARPEQADSQLGRIRWDTMVGIGFANTIAFFIMLTTAVTLHTSGLTQIQTSAEAALALRPVAGDLAFVLFSLGIVGTGLLAVPVLAGSASYAICESRGWVIGLEHKPRDAVAFYTVIGLAVLIGLAVDYSPLDPVRALFWSAVLNGVISPILMAAMMVVASRRDSMGQFVAPLGLRLLGWTATGCMAIAAASMFILG